MVTIYDPLAESAGNILAKFGFCTDVHMADKNNSGDRNYRDADEKLAAAVAAWNTAEVDFEVMCGDLTDGYDNTNKPQTLIDLAAIEAVYDNANAPRHYVFGSNHDPEELTKAELIANTGGTAMYYSFDVGNLHVIILDAGFESYSDSDPYGPGNTDWTNGTWISPAQIAWLKADLAATTKETIAFCHMRLDGAPDSVLRGYRVFNADVVRSLFVRSGKVRHVFTGHEHECQHAITNNICYHRMEAMTENAYPENAYAIITIYDNGWVSVDGNSTRQTTYTDAVRMPA